MGQIKNYNKALIKGDVKEVINDSTFILGVKRYSGYEDLIKVKYLFPEEISVGDTVAIYGQVKTDLHFNNPKNNSISLYIHANQISDGTEIEEDYHNEVIISGCICKKPILRTTSLAEKTIAEVVVSVVEQNGTNLIHCIAWSNKARRLSYCKQGDAISLEGRFQSREYNKHMDDDSIEVRTAFEISINSFSLT